MLGIAAGWGALAATAALAQTPPANDPDAAPAQPDEPFSFDTVMAQARQLAGEAHEPQQIELKGTFAELDYDHYRAIRFRPERRLWREEKRGFELDLLPPGFYYKDRIEIALVSDGVVHALDFDPSVFHYHPDYFPAPDGAAPADAPHDLAYSGFRVRFPINRPDVMDEFLVFQGASYFRAVARDQLYGLSARGLALGTGGPEGEEFPLFRQFWIHEPEVAATSLTIHALLDSPSVTGAYEFVVRPGVETVMDVRSVLFPRVELTGAGIAPLTSMYFFGPKSRARIDDYRDAVHDSSGLQMVTGAGERIWRPLDNPLALQFSAFSDHDPQGFGLTQRERAFIHYEDAEARYERRPSAWVAPSNAWGQGSVVLVEIPTDTEFNDNVVAFWRPAEPLARGSEHHFDYRLLWTGEPPDETPLARVVATRGGVKVSFPEDRSFVVDFDLGEVPFEGLEPRVTATAGEIKHVALVRLPAEARARAVITFHPGDAGLAELRLFLVDAEGRPASETWLARWTPR
ncbi:MAG: glucan biosynthesis protein G [Geminicoccaceae bacterium]